MEESENTEEVKDEENSKESPNEHPVFEALKDSKDDVELVRNFFEIDGVPIDVQDNAGMTALMHACWKGYEKMVKFLLKQVSWYPILITTLLFSEKEKLLSPK